MAGEFSPTALPSEEDPKVSTPHTHTEELVNFVYVISNVFSLTFFSIFFFLPPPFRFRDVQRYKGNFRDLIG